MILKQYLTSLIAFIVIDGVWLGLISPRFYRSQIGHLMKPEADLKVATLFYLLFLIGLNIFVIGPQQDRPLLTVAGYGALFGLITYATFDLTSVAVFKDFPYLVALVDLIWGATLCAVISVITVWMTRT